MAIDFRPAIRGLLAGIDPALGTGGLRNPWTWVSVSSSNVGSVGYNDLESAMRVRFLNGSEYEYDGVPRGVFEGMVGAASVGKYLAYNVKGHYAYARVG